MDAAERKGISHYLLNLLKDYLTNRYITFGSEKVEISRGVSQGSILGPLLWIVAYDGVLELQLPQGATFVAYADDLALMVDATDERGL